LGDFVMTYFPVKKVSTALYLPGVKGSYASAPYVPGMATPGDMDIRWIGSKADWTPVASSPCVARWAGSPNRQWSFGVGRNSTGRLEFSYSTTGSDYPEKFSTVPVPFSDGDVGGVRVTVDVDNGAGGMTLTFYTSTDRGVTWNQLGDPVVDSSNGASPIHQSTVAIMEIGTYIAGEHGVHVSTTHSAEVRNGIGGAVVASPDFTQGKNNISPDKQGNVWTVHGTGPRFIPQPDPIIYGDYTAKLTDTVLTCDGTLTVNLPSGTANCGRRYVVKNRSATASVTVNAGTETIDGKHTQTLTPADAMIVVSNGTEWIITSKQ
jgi:hypothetical protein